VKATLGWALACLVLACAAAAGCSGDDDGHRVYASALDGALAHLRDDSAAAFAIATDLDSEAPGRNGELKAGGRRALGAVARSQLGQRSIPFEAVIRSQLGNPLVVGITRRGSRVSAIRLRSPGRLRRNLEQLLGHGTVARLESHNGAIVWKDSRAGRTSKFGALADRELVVAASERDLHEAIDAARGPDNLASNRAVRVKLSDPGLVNGVGDAQRLLDTGDPGRTADARSVRWIRSLGIFDLHVNPRRSRLSLDFRLSTRRVPLSEGDLPLAPGAASPRIHDPDAAASVAVLEPQQLVSFLEKTLRATDSTRFQRYETGIEQLRAILRIDLRRDLVDKIESLSVAARSATSLTFVASLAPGSAAGFRKDLDRAELFVQGVIGDAIPNTSVTARGFGAQRVWIVKNGDLAIARYAVRGEALIGSVGPGPLPRPSGGRRLRGVTGSLAIKGDLGRIGRLLDFVFQVPNDVFSVVSKLGDLTLGVRTDSEQLRGRGWIRVP
jgi:hypothetical protein